MKDIPPFRVPKEKRKRMKKEAQENKLLKSELFRSAAIPILFVLVLWIIEMGAEWSGVRMIKLGIHPLTLEGLTGIITSPFIHGDIDHLLSNTAPLLIVGTGIIFFYKELAYKVFAYVWLMTGVWVWLFARPDWHIGASGLIYGLVCFLFFSGLLRKDTRLMAVSLLVTFLYGSLVWGILPIDQTISWESHLFGSVAGIYCAIYFRKEGPEQTKPQWLIDEENGILEVSVEEEVEPLTTEEIEKQSDEVKVTYHYKPKDEE